MSTATASTRANGRRLCSAPLGTAAVAAAVITLLFLVGILWSDGRRHQPGPGPGTGDDPVPESGHTLSASQTGVTNKVGNNQVLPSGPSAETSGDHVTGPPPFPVPVRGRLPHSVVEYVKPIKVSPPPLHQHDLLFGEDLMQTPEDLPDEPAALHSGHFRQHQAAIWDPHPRYTFVAFGQNFQLQLQHDRSFVAPQIVVAHISRNSSVRSSAPTACFYSGRVIGDPVSTVAVSLCRGMTGHIRTSTGNFFIEPAEKENQDTENNAEASPPSPSLLHAIYRLTPPPVTNNVEDVPEPQCGVIYDDADMLRAQTANPVETDLESGQILESEPKTEPKANMDVDKRRRRRSVQHDSDENNSALYTIEVLVAYDSAMAAYHGEKVKEYVLTLMSIVALIYRDATIGNPINVAVVKLVLADYGLPGDAQRRGPHRGISASEMLRRFCAWQMKHRGDRNGFGSHDAALLLTRENICRDPDTNTCDTLGLAELGTVCQKESSCAIVQDNGLSAAFTIAHELGHVLSMPHDDDSRCKEFRGTSTTQHIMARMLDNNTQPWSWSNCSRHFLTEFLETERHLCLNRTSYESHIKPRSNLKMPGEKFDENKQCELVFGRGSKICPYMPMCKPLWCTTDVGEQMGCRTHHMPWADGTSCGHDMWCQKGQCVYRNMRSLDPVDGGWGPWQRWSECSRTCGGGVMKSTRECNKPSPSNGGRYCLGKRVQYKSCNTHECPEGAGSRDFRAEQCAKFNNNNFHIHGVPSDVKWVPKYGTDPPKDSIDEDERCKLFCRVAGSPHYYLLRDKVEDGTTCAPDTHDICVNGICKPAGCDHILDSRASLDRCGVCNGNGTTCVVIRGHHDSWLFGYTDVVTIPAGARNIDIRLDMKNMTFLALFDPDTNINILNGNYSVSVFKKTMVYGGASIEYSGTAADVQRINSSLTLRRPLLVKVLCAGDAKPLNIVYQYTIQRSDLYRWHKTGRWSQCDRLCQGKKVEEADCVQVDTNTPVSAEYCAGAGLSSLDERPCNEHCELSWQISSGTSTDYANPRCPGNCSLVWSCFLRDVRGGSPTQVSSEHCREVSRPSETEDCDRLCRARWLYNDWGQCSEQNGHWSQSRSAMCVDGFHRQVDDGFCERSQGSKALVKTCAHWVSSGFSECSASCGWGEQKMLHSCEEDGQVRPREECAGITEPAHSQECYSRCDWKSGPWEPCSASCGIGTKIRSVECVGADGQTLSEEHCPSNSRPNSSEECLNRPCPLPTTTILPDSLRHFEYNDRSDNDPEMNSLFPTHTSYISTWNNKVYQHGGYEWSTRWSQCSATCGRGNRSLVIYCKERDSGRTVDSVYCPMNKRPANDVISCFNPKACTWYTGKWSECSASCGQGERSRRVYCQDPSGQILSDHECTTKRPGDRETCSKGVCQLPEWRMETWGPCSQSCGGGWRSRLVDCPGPKCIGSAPASSEVCNTHPCPQTKWAVTQWGKCNVTCGTGVQVAEVACVSEMGEKLSDRDCWDKPKPSEARMCQANNCPTVPTGQTHKPSKRGPPNSTGHKERHKKPPVKNLPYRWKKGPFGKCSKSCGQGQRSRVVQCVSTVTGEVVSPSNCNHLREKPKAVRGCNVAPCPYDWLPDDWTECTKPCGVGYQSRRVKCHRFNALGWPEPESLPSEMCNATAQPPTYQNCNTHACDAKFFWYAGPWKECSESCGHKGRQVREVFCMRKDGRKAQRVRRCDLKTKPGRKRKCNQRPCGFKSCSEARSAMNTRRDGEYRLNILGANASIYCNGMNTDDPKEYITLVAGESENFAEIYDKTLLRPETCPFNGNRSNDCQCSTYESQGITLFRRVRLDLYSMKIDTRDWRFSKTLKGFPVPYGEAGDCYSNASCPQGRFAINLLGTAFRVADVTRWSEYGDKTWIKVHRHENDRKISGLCGGYCGGCRPLEGLKLDVLPP